MKFGGPITGPGAAAPATVTSLFTYDTGGGNCVAMFGLFNWYFPGAGGTPQTHYITQALPNLESLGIACSDNYQVGDLYCSGLQKLETASISGINHSSSNLYFDQCPVLTTLSCSGTSGYSLNIAQSSALVSLTVNLPDLYVLWLPASSSLTMCNFWGCYLSQGDIDNVLALCVAGGQEDGYVDVSGQNSYPNWPSETGMGHVATLLATGWTAVYDEGSE